MDDDLDRYPPGEAAARRRIRELEEEVERRGVALQYILNVLMAYGGGGSILADEIRAALERKP